MQLTMKARMAFQHLVERCIIPAQLLLSMAGMGATLGVAEFLLVFRAAKGLLLGLGLQLVFVPLVAIALISVFDVSKGWAVGLILIAVVPGGAFSNLLTYVGRANAALSVALTALSNVVCVATIPVLLKVLVPEYVATDFRLPTMNIVRDIVGFLLLPLAAGMILLRLRSRAAAAFSRWAVRASVVLLVCIVISSLGSGRIDIASYGWKPPLLLILFGSMLCFSTAQLCRLLGRDDEDNVALTIEVTIRNVGLALLLVQFFFEREPAQGHVLYAVLFYGGMSFFLGIPVVLLSRAGRSPALFWAPHARHQMIRTCDKARSVAPTD